jgi:hypothetical protein
MSNAKTGRFSGPGEGNVYAKANEVIVKITGADTNQTFEVVEENCKPGFQSRADYHIKAFETFYVFDGSAAEKKPERSVDLTNAFSENLARHEGCANPRVLQRARSDRNHASRWPPAAGSPRKCRTALLSGSRGVWHDFASFLRPPRPAKTKATTIFPNLTDFGNARLK